MSGADALLSVTERLIKLLEDHFADNQMDVPVVSESPLTTEKKAGDTGTKLSLFLYLVRRDEHRQYPSGISWSPTKGTRASRAEPIALRLYYLITAFAEDQLVQQRLLGHTMQVMADNAVLPRQEHDPTAIQAMQVVLLNLDITEMNAIWNTTTAVRETSLAYEISSVLLDPSAPIVSKVRPIEGVRVSGHGMPSLDAPADPVFHSGQRLRLTGSHLDVTEDLDKVRVVFRDVAGGRYRDTVVKPDLVTRQRVEVVAPTLTHGGQLWLTFGPELTSTSIAWAAGEDAP